MPPKYFISSPPWGLDREWKEANRSFKIHIDRYRSELGSVFLSAQDVRNRLALISSLLHTLALETCRFCPGSCCQTASPWYDFRDLLFLHLTDVIVPERQLLQQRNDICRYESPAGCRLERLQRPFVCTWYLCPAQKRELDERTAEKKIVFVTLQEIKSLRKEMEISFIKALAPG